VFSFLMATGLSPLGQISAAICNIWFLVWALRRQGELDYELDSTAKRIRWTVVAIFLGTPILRPELFNSLPSLRLWVALVGLLFLVWPNFAYHLTRLLRSLRVIAKPDKAPANPEI
jgi:hypothetical protein